MNADLRTAIETSQARDERVSVDYAGDVHALLVDLDELYDGDIDDAEENDGTIDVWGCSDSDSSMDWRLKVTLVADD